MLMISIFLKSSEFNIKIQWMLQDFNNILSKVCYLSTIIIYYSISI